ncbi:MAG: bifunctional demethylmenaquinone methyltransferase/2-methoxy-6-polyprenyl,4-benzoquinol methylase [Bacteroidota bacterium]|jgi:demethylmenaquinone methyltransferase/2-methoxy-6-polyprenyl-1,4-benzoquinol methylase
MSKNVTPYADSTATKKQQVTTMFNNIAWRYDILNRLLSLGIDKIWRKKTIATLQAIKPQLILDIATGTADLALAALALNPEKIIGIDISEDMLAKGREKIKRKKLAHKIELLQGDSEQLIFEDNKFDAVTVAFGVRNFENLDKGLKEIFRVLKPGGQCSILEFSKPKSGLIKPFYNIYTKNITPKLGKWISGDDRAYTYLHDSVQAFPEGEAFIKHLDQAGFKNLKQKRVTFGTVTIYQGKK